MNSFDSTTILRSYESVVRSILDCPAHYFENPTPKQVSVLINVLTLFVKKIGDDGKMVGKFGPVESRKTTNSEAPFHSLRQISPYEVIGEAGNSSHEPELSRFIAELRSQIESVLHECDTGKIRSEIT
jgi:hypothetical protein